MAVYKTMDVVQKWNAFRQIHNAFNIWKELFTAFIHDLPINLLVLVYQT